MMEGGSEAAVAAPDEPSPAARVLRFLRGSEGRKLPECWHEKIDEWTEDELREVQEAARTSSVVTDLVLVIGGDTSEETAERIADVVQNFGNVSKFEIRRRESKAVPPGVVDELLWALTDSPTSDLRDVAIGDSGGKQAIQEFMKKFRGIHSLRIGHDGRRFFGVGALSEEFAQSVGDSLSYGGAGLPELQSLILYGRPNFGAAEILRCAYGACKQLTTLSVEVHDGDHKALLLEGVVATCATNAVRTLRLFWLGKELPTLDLAPFFGRSIPTSLEKVKFSNCRFPGADLVAPSQALEEVQDFEAERCEFVDTATSTLEKLPRLNRIALLVPGDDEDEDTFYASRQLKGNDDIEAFAQNLATRPMIDKVELVIGDPTGKATFPAIVKLFKRCQGELELEFCGLRAAHMDYVNRGLQSCGALLKTFHLRGFYPYTAAEYEDERYLARFFDTLATNETLEGCGLGLFWLADRLEDIDECNLVYEMESLTQSVGQSVTKCVAGNLALRVLDLGYMHPIAAEVFLKSCFLGLKENRSLRELHIYLDDPFVLSEELLRLLLEALFRGNNVFHRLGGDVLFPESSSDARVASMARRALACMQRNARREKRIQEVRSAAEKWTSSALWRSARAAGLEIPDDAGIDKQTLAKLYAEAVAEGELQAKQHAALPSAQESATSAPDAVQSPVSRQDAHLSYRSPQGYEFHKISPGAAVRVENPNVIDVNVDVWECEPGKVEVMGEEPETSDKGSTSLLHRKRREGRFPDRDDEIRIPTGNFIDLVNRSENMTCWIGCAWNVNVKESTLESRREARIQEAISEAMSWTMFYLRSKVREMGLASSWMYRPKEALAKLYAESLVNENGEVSVLRGRPADPFADLPALVSSSTEISMNGIWVLTPRDDGAAVDLRCAVVQDGEIKVDRIPPVWFRNGSMLIPCSRTNKAYVYEPQRGASPSRWRVYLKRTLVGPPIKLFDLDFDPSRTQFMACPIYDDVWALTKATGEGEGSSITDLMLCRSLSGKTVRLLQMSCSKVRLAAVDEDGAWLVVEGESHSGNDSAMLSPGLWFVSASTTEPLQIHCGSIGKHTAPAGKMSIWTLDPVHSTSEAESTSELECTLSLVSVQKELEISCTTLKLPFDKVKAIVPAFQGVYVHYKPPQDGEPYKLIYAPPDKSRLGKAKRCPKNWTLMEAFVSGGVWVWKKIWQDRVPYLSLSFFSKDGSELDSATKFRHGSTIANGEAK